MIRQCTENDISEIYEIINDSAQAYRGIIPEDRWHDPYMSREKLSLEIQDGIIFWGEEQDSRLIGIMGIQDKGEVTLIRHAYVRTTIRNQGVGTRLLRHLEIPTNNPILIGTWADAVWAISFYQKNGYQLVTPEEKNRLLKQYWNIPERQVETSVVLADSKWTSQSNDK
ncbi:MAG: N-acetyltransferase [Deltaproteobacteria bacterium]|nr:MAG: N-acetyltransferase [Deltaproteobacteria bacterium]